MIAPFVATLLAAAAEIVVPATAKCPPPVFPESERATAVGGQLVVRVMLDASAQVKSAVIVQPLSRAFDAAALDAVTHCTFTAAQRDGHPAAALIEMTITFVPPPKPVAPAPAPVAEETKPIPHFEATIVASRSFLPDAPTVDHTPTVSHFEISRADVDRTPGALEDISRVVDTLPGVAADPDLLATFFVRGGGPNEVLFSLDGVPLSNPFHLGGFATVFNPMLIESAQFYAGTAPASFAPALSGVLDVAYANGDATRPHVEADVSMNTAKLRAEAPTGVDGLSAMIAARRSYYELYFAGMRALHLVGQNYVAPDIGEYLGRVNFHRGHHEINAMYLRSSDGLSFVIKPGEELLVNFAGGLQLSNVLQLGMLRDRIDLGAARALSLTAAITHDADHTAVASDISFARDVTRQMELFRADLTLPFSERHRLLIGAQLAHQRYIFTGELPDTRNVAPWASLPIVDTGAANLNLSPQITQHGAAIYAEHLFRPWAGFSLESGARLEAADTSTPLYVVRGALAQELSTGGVLKLSAGMVTERVGSPLLRDPTYGNPSLSPERSVQVVLGLEQLVPIGLLRLEAWGKWLDQLAVNPDSQVGVQRAIAAGQPVYQSIGSGFARGVDLLLLGRTRRWAYGASSGFVYSDRENPLATGRERYPAPWDQRVTLAAHVSWTPTDDWLLAAQATFHTGRPFTSVLGFTRDETQKKFVPIFGATNSARYPTFFEASVRVQRRFSAWALPMAWYAELLNVTNAQNEFAQIYGKGDFAGGVPPVAGTFNHLPIRPFLGVRGEY